MKLLISLVAFAIGFSSMAQERIKVKGDLIFPEGENAEGVVIFNMNSRAGTITQSKGEFSLLVTEGDSIRISPQEYQEFIVLVNKEVIESAEMNIYLNQVVNFLPEVVVTPFGLSGNVTVDVAKIPVAVLPEDFSASENSDIFLKENSEPDYYSPPLNTALASNENRLINGLNFVNLFKELLISGKKEEIKDPYSGVSIRDVDLKVRAMYNDNFFRRNLGVELQDINEFIYFADDNGLEEEMLKTGNELELIQFLVEQSKRYKKQKYRD